MTRRGGFDKSHQLCDAEIIEQNQPPHFCTAAESPRSQAKWGGPKSLKVHLVHAKAARIAGIHRQP